MLESLAQDLKAEAAYYWPEDGKRAWMMVFDMADSSEIPRIAEQLFLKVDASVQFTPVMNADDLKKALAAMSS